MVPLESFVIPNPIMLRLEEMVEKNCCLVKVGCYKSIRIGVGEVVEIKNPRFTAFHGAWEIGAYNAAWRVIQNGKIVCGSSDPIDQIQELQVVLDGLKFGLFRAITPLSAFDFRIVFNNETTIDILCTFQNSDEIIHIFFPDGWVASYAYRVGWDIELGRKPWFDRTE